MPTLAQFVTWILIGLLAGGLAGRIVTWQRRGYGLFGNLALGLAGALVGGLIFGVFDIWPELTAVTITLRDIVSAMLGALVVVLALWLWRKIRPQPVADRPAPPPSPPPV